MPRPQLPDLHSVAKAVVDAAAKGAFRGGLMIEGRAKEIVREERFATGRLMQSISTKMLPPDEGRIVVVVGSHEPYAPFVEYDTRPHTPPIEPLLRWATTKGYRTTGRSYRSGSEAQKRLAWIAWAAIRRRGTKGIHFLARAAQEKKQEVIEHVNRSVREAVSRFAR